MIHLDISNHTIMWVYIISVDSPRWIELEVRDWSLITGRGGGGAIKWEEGDGQVKYYPYKKGGGGGGKSFSHAEGGGGGGGRHNKFFR